MGDDLAMAAEKASTENIIWHYTIVDTACKILEGKNMRATYYTGLNDRLDVKYGFGITLQVLRNMDLKDALFKKLEKVVQDIVDDRYPNLWYIICFSHEGDSIAQWQGYTAPQYGGCAIGFDKNRIERLFFDCGDKPEVKNFSPRPIECLYQRDVRIFFKLLKDYQILFYIK